MAVINDSVASLSGSGPAQEIAVSQVSEEFFQVLGANPLLGRVLAPDDYEPGRHRVLVLSHALWASSFGADPSIGGRTITLATEPFTVIGVMPPRITYPSDTLAWAPLAATPALRQTMESRGALWLEVIARMKPGVAPATAQAAMDVVQARYNAAYPTATPGTGIYVAPMHQDIVESVARSLWLLQGAVLAVLLIACANISNLMLARATARQREVATRIALGAGWRRIAQECFTEALLLATIGAAFGIALAVALVRMLPSFAPAQLPMLDGVSIDWVVGLAAAVLTVATAIIVGLAPIVQGRRTDVSARDQGRRTSGIRRRRQQPRSARPCRGTDRHRPCAAGRRRTARQELRQRVVRSNRLCRRSGSHRASLAARGSLPDAGEPARDLLERVDQASRRAAGREISRRGQHDSARQLAGVVADDAGRPPRSAASGADDAGRDRLRARELLRHGRAAIALRQILLRTD